LFLFTFCLDWEGKSVLLFAHENYAVGEDLNAGVIEDNHQTLRQEIWYIFL
jgi:hypothetical protein